MKTRRSFLRSLLAAAALPFAARLIGGNKDAVSVPGWKRVTIKKGMVPTDTPVYFTDPKFIGETLAGEATDAAKVQAAIATMLYEQREIMQIQHLPLPVRYELLGPTPPAC